MRNTRPPNVRWTSDCIIRQRPTLPGDFFCLNPAQRAAEKILTKYNVGRWLENDLEEEPDGIHKEKAPDIV